ncbi:hypothetical protein KEM55_004358 [Ascosphaera atra]|nr:hypothetical protein KEM55_004358 [Ascosphaera atra]
MDDAHALTFYPPFCQRVSPTYNTWVKMRTADLSLLTTRPGFEGAQTNPTANLAYVTPANASPGQNVYFFQNHPIQFFCVAGILLSRDDYEGRVSMILDDSSGVTLEVVVPKVISSTNDVAVVVPDEDGDSYKRTTTGIAPTVTAQTVTATTRAPIDINALKPGLRVKFKGTLTRHRQQRGSGNANAIQEYRHKLHMERYQILPDLASEVFFWRERTRMLAEILCVPWELCDEEINALQQEAERDALESERRAVRARRRVRERAQGRYERGLRWKWDADRRAEERARRRVERDEKDRERIWRRWEREDDVRRRDVERVRRVNERWQREKEGRAVLDTMGCVRL